MATPDWGLQGAITLYACINKRYKQRSHCLIGFLQDFAVFQYILSPLMLFSAPFYPAESAKYHPCHLDITLPTVNIPCKMAGRPYWQPETVSELPRYTWALRLPEMKIEVTGCHGQMTGRRLLSFENVSGLLYHATLSGSKSFRIPQPLSQLVLHEVPRYMMVNIAVCDRTGNLLRCLFIQWDLGRIDDFLWYCYYLLDEGHFYMCCKWE